MAGFFLGLLAVVAVLSSILLMLVVLLQEPKGGGIASALGGSGMEAIGPAVGGVNRFTAWVAAVWMVCCFLHATMMSRSVTAPAPSPSSPPAQEGAPADGGTEKKGG